MFILKSYNRIREIDVALYGGPRDLAQRTLPEDYSRGNIPGLGKLEEGMIYHQMKINENNALTRKLMKCIEGKLVEVKMVLGQGLVPVHCS